jgi:hypothetical protein
VFSRHGDEDLATTCLRPSQEEGERVIIDDQEHEVDARIDVHPDIVKIILTPNENEDAAMEIDIEHHLILWAARQIKLLGSGETSGGTNRVGGSRG